MCDVANNCKHSTIIGWVVIVVERELDVFGFNDEYVEVNNGKNYTLPYL